MSKTTRKALEKRAEILEGAGIARIRIPKEADVNALKRAEVLISKAEEELPRVRAEWEGRAPAKDIPSEPVEAPQAAPGAEE